MERIRSLDDPRVAVLFGNEMDGLDAASLSLCHARVTIPVASSVDSLNLGVAAGIFMHAIQRGR